MSKFGNIASLGAAVDGSRQHASWLEIAGKTVCALTVLLSFGSSLFSQPVLAQQAVNQSPVFIDTRRLPPPGETEASAELQAALRDAEEARNRLTQALKARHLAEQERDQAVAALKKGSIEAKAQLLDAVDERKRLTAELRTKEKILIAQRKLAAIAQAQAEAAQQTAQRASSQGDRKAPQLTARLETLQAAHSKLRAELRQAEMEIARARQANTTRANAVQAASEARRKSETALARTIEALKTRISQLETELAKRIERVAGAEEQAIEAQRRALKADRNRKSIAAQNQRALTTLQGQLQAANRERNRLLSQVEAAKVNAAEEAQRARSLVEKVGEAVAQRQSALAAQRNAEAQVQRLTLEFRQQAEADRTARQLALAQQARLAAELAAVRFAEIEREREALRATRPTRTKSSSN